MIYDVQWRQDAENGLTIATCNVIFWSVVVPIGFSGAELLFLSNKCINFLKNFQLYADKRIQRFYKLIPNVCAYCSLGWISLERLVKLKKLLFILSVMLLEKNICVRKVFCVRGQFLFKN